MKTSADVQFSRGMLRLVLADVKRVTEPQQRKEAWVYMFANDHWEFHGPGKFYWHGRASNAYDARCKGWTAWLERNHVGREIVGATHG